MLTTSSIRTFFVCLFLEKLSGISASSSSTTSSGKCLASAPQMLAVRLHEFGGPENLKLETCDIPPPPNHDQVLIMVKAAAIYPWDVKIRKNQYARPPVAGLPAILGQEVSGVVLMKGKNVNHIKVGDRVFAKLVFWEGGYAQLALANAIDTYPLPKTFTYEQGAITYHLYFGAWRGLIYKVHAKPGQTLLVIGANRGNGLAAIQVGKSYGLTVFATAGDKLGLAKVKEFGADYTIDHTDPDFREVAKKLNNNENFDIILEDYSIENVPDDHPYIKKFTGQLLRHTGIEVGETSEIRGFNLFTPTDNEKNGTRHAVFDGIKEGWYTPYVGRHYLMHQARRAHIDLLNKEQCGDFVFSSMDQHEYLFPFMSEELQHNVSHLITPAIRDLVELYQAPDPDHSDAAVMTAYSGEPEVRREFLSKNVFHQLYGGTTVVTKNIVTDFWSEMWYKYSTNTIDLDLTHDAHFENYLRDYVWWTMPPNRTKSKTPPTTTTRDPTASTMNKWDELFYYNL